MSQKRLHGATCAKGDAMRDAWGRIDGGRGDLAASAVLDDLLEKVEILACLAQIHTAEARIDGSAYSHRRADGLVGKGESCPTLRVDVVAQKKLIQADGAIHPKL